MREDMTSVITGRPRSGSSFRKRKGVMRLLQRDPDALPQRESMSPGRLHRDDNSRLHSAPLYRYLRTQVGRPWNQVYSDICHGAPADTVNGRRLQDRISWAVDLQVERRGDRLVVMPHGYSVGGLYVDPDTGLLQSTPTVPRRRYPPYSRKPFEVVDIDGDGVHRCVKVDGTWYRVKLMSLPESEEEANSMEPGRKFDLILRLAASGKEKQLQNRNNPFRTLWDGYLLAVQKLQLSKKDMARVRVVLARQRGETLPQSQSERSGKVEPRRRAPVFAC